MKKKSGKGCEILDIGPVLFWPIPLQQTADRDVTGGKYMQYNIIKLF